MPRQSIPIRPTACPRPAAEEDDPEETLVTNLADFEPPPVDDEERYASPQPPHQRRFRRPLIGYSWRCCRRRRTGMAYGWTRTQYFVGADQDKVAIFQGLPDGLLGCLCRGSTRFSSWR